MSKKRKKINVSEKAAQFAVNPFSDLQIKVPKVLEPTKILTEVAKDPLDSLSKEDKEYMLALADTSMAIEFSGRNKRHPKLNIQTSKKGRGGKTVTLVSGFLSETQDELMTLLQNIKTELGVGGMFYEKTLEIQGNQSERLKKYFEKIKLN